MREGLATVLDRDPLLSITGLCADFGDGLELLRDVDVVLLDARFPNGTTAVRRILATAPEAKVVVFAVTETEENIIAWAEAGTAGYIPTTAALQDLVHLLFAILRGEQICPGRVTSALIRRVADPATNSTRGMLSPQLAPMLTIREREIIGLVCSGMSNKEIARRLNIALSTTKSHVHNILGKLNLRRRGQAAPWMRSQSIFIRSS
jgi:DNA-binding NarL/FixJ family response regulator